MAHDFFLNNARNPLDIVDGIARQIQTYLYEVVHHDFPIMWPYKQHLVEEQLQIWNEKLRDIPNPKDRLLAITETLHRWGSTADLIGRIQSDEIAKAETDGSLIRGQQSLGDAYIEMGIQNPYALALEGLKTRQRLSELSLAAVLVAFKLYAPHHPDEARQALQNLDERTLEFLRPIYEEDFDFTKYPLCKIEVPNQNTSEAFKGIVTTIQSRKLVDNLINFTHDYDPTSPESLPHVFPAKLERWSYMLTRLTPQRAANEFLAMLEDISRIRTECVMRNPDDMFSDRKTWLDIATEDHRQRKIQNPEKTALEAMTLRKDYALLTLERFKTMFERFYEQYPELALAAIKKMPEHYRASCQTQLAGFMDLDAIEVRLGTALELTPRTFDF